MSWGYVLGRELHLMQSAASGPAMATSVMVTKSMICSVKSDSCEKSTTIGLLLGALCSSELPDLLDIGWLLNGK